MYRALYRKYRSKTFDELYGQSAIVDSLKSQVRNKELSHAYLFSGTRGTGKTSAAKILSRAVNCLNPQDGNPCNECENCKSILNDTVMDVVEMDAASNNGVDDIRELKEKVIYPPANLKYKVYIIDEVHMLSKGAFNALLKVLEEPPSHLIFILCTTEIEKIPATILSRTQKFNFKRISIKEITENLKRIAKEENKSCDEEVYTFIAKNSDGAMRDALSVFDQLLTYPAEHLNLSIAMEILGYSNSDLLFNLTRALVKKDINKSIDALSELSKSGVDFISLNNSLIKHFRDLMLVKTLKNPQEVVISEYMDEFYIENKNISLESILRIIDILKDITMSIRYVEDPKILIEMGIIKICELEDNDTILNRLENLENKLKDGFIITENKASKEKIREVNKKEESSEVHNVDDIFDNKNEKIENEGKINSLTKIKEENSAIIEKEKKSDIINSDLTLEDFKRDWKEILSNIRSLQVSLYAILIEAYLKSFNNNTLEIAFDKEHEFHYNTVSTKEKKNVIKDVLNNKYNVDIDIRISLEKSKDKLNELFGAENIEEI